MKIKFTKRGTVVEEMDVNTADPAVAKAKAIIGLGQLRGQNKADAWEIVNEIDTVICTSEGK
jgi:hypothetical protein